LETSSLTLWIASACLLLFLAASVLTTWLLSRAQSRSLQAVSSSFQATALRALESADRALQLAASSDALTYQAIRAVEPERLHTEGVYDPSEEGEIRRIAERRGALTDDPDLDEDELDDVTASALDDFFGAR
jgi:hypothetical protein